MPENPTEDEIAAFLARYRCPDDAPITAIAWPLVKECRLVELDGSLSAVFDRWADGKPLLSASGKPDPVTVPTDGYLVQAGPKLAAWLPEGWYGPGPEEIPAPFAIDRDSPFALECVLRWFTTYAIPTARRLTDEGCYDDTRRRRLPQRLVDNAHLIAKKLGLACDRPIVSAMDPAACEVELERLRRMVEHGAERQPMQSDRTDQDECVAPNPWDNFPGLHDLAENTLKGKQRRTVILLVACGGMVPLADLATEPGIEWDSHDGPFNDMRKALNSQFRKAKLPYKLSRHNNAAKLISTRKAAARK